MSRTKNLIQMLSACEKHEFDTIVKTYLKVFFGFNRIVNTDGKNDSGLDIRVFDIGGVNNQYQLTTQKSGTPQQQAKLKDKIFEDVAKATRNHEMHGYDNTLYFFYSYELTQTKRLEYERQAKVSYNIHLTIIDAKRIAEESEGSLELERAIYDTSGLKEYKLRESLYHDPQRNLIYDLVSFGTTSDIKLEIVEAFIIQCLYEKQTLSIVEIAQLCMDQFSSTDENANFYTKLVNNMYSKKGKICYNKTTKLYYLSEDEYQRVSQLMQQIQNDEQFFINEIGNILHKYNQETQLEQYIKLLINLYTSNFSKRIRLSDDIMDLGLTPLFSLAKRISTKQEDCQMMIRELLQLCDDNKYLQRICASSVFSSEISYDDLQNYAREQKIVYIDTTIALHLICYYYRQRIDYENYDYQLSKHLFEYCRKHGIKLHITDRYIWEITRHVQESKNLVPFTKLHNFSSLGESKNVFYNYYCFLKDINEINCSYIEYLKDLDFLVANTTYEINKVVENHLSNFDVELIEIPKSYDWEETSKLISNKLIDTHRNKTPFALKNDAIMLEYLGDGKEHIVDPVFITWDKTLFGVLKDFFAKPYITRWMQFTPSQFIDRYSLLSFSINEETITKEVLAMLSNQIVQHTYSLLDSLALILNPDKQIGLEYTQKFIEMRDSQIYTVGKQSDGPQESSDNGALENVIYNIINHYRENELEFNNFKKLFLEKEYMDNVFAILQESVTRYSQNNAFDNNTITKLDLLIKTI